MLRTIVVLALLPWLAACGGGSSGETCTTSADCPSAERCVDGFCHEVDAGPGVDSGRPPDSGGTDGGPRTDGGGSTGCVGGCDDDNPCTIDACVGGTTCAHENIGNAVGQTCHDGDLCTTRDVCVDGACVGMDPVICTPLSQCHTAGMCEPATGECTNPTMAFGTPCDDNDFCSPTDVCQVDGWCRGIGVSLSGWQTVATIEYIQNDPDNHWAVEQLRSYTVGNARGAVRVTGSTDDGGYCYAHWGTGHIERYRHPGPVGIYNVDDRIYIPPPAGIGNCPTYPPTFDGAGTVRICQGNTSAGAFAYGTGDATALPEGTAVTLRGRHSIGSGGDGINCYLQIDCSTATH